MQSFILQILIQSIIMGSSYALLGLSWGIVYATSGIFHFSHSLVIVVAAYAAVLFTKYLGLPFVAGYIAAIVVAVILGCGIEWGIYRPLRKIGATMFVVFVASMGLATAGQYIIQMIFTAVPRTIADFSIISIPIGPSTTTNSDLLMLIVSILAILGIYIFMKNTKSGKAIRAVACNPDMAEVVGIDRGKIFLLVMAFGSVGAALFAIPYTLNNGAIPSMGFSPLLTSFIVTFIGGSGSIVGALAAGLALGLLQNLSLLVFSSQWQTTASFVALIIVIILRPRGLLPIEKAGG